MFRRFGNVHCRILLHLEAELTALEKELHALDIHDSERPKMLYRLKRCEWDDSWDPTQRDLLDKLKKKLAEYGQ